MKNIKTTVRLLITVACCAAMLIGCATTSQPGYLPDGRYCFRESKKLICTADPVPAVAQEAVAKQFVADPDAVTVWVVRNTRLDAYGRVPLSVGATNIETLPYTLSRAITNPGQLVIVLNKSNDGQPLIVEGNRGEQVFVEVAADVGLFATRFSLRRIAEDEGRRKALASKLVKDIRVMSRP